MKKFSTLAMILLAGCATMPMSRPYTQLETFDPAEVEWSKHPGSGKIEGSAVLRTRGGDVKTCAGLPVSLMPASKYGTERVRHTFTNDSAGFERSDAAPFAATDPRFLAANKQSVCDAQGHFSFDHLAAGAYYVIAKVAWEAPSQYGLTAQGGFMVQKVTVADGETKQIVITA